MLKKVFNLIFYVILSKKTRLLQSIDQWLLRREGVSTKSILGYQKTIKTIFSRVRYLFLLFIYYFFPQIINSCTLLSTDQNRFSLKVNFIMSVDELGSKFSFSPIWRKGCWEGQKRKICLFLSQSIENQMLYNISINQPPSPQVN